MKEKNVAFFIRQTYSLFREVCPLKQIYGKVIKIKGKCQKMKGNIKNVRFPQGKITPSIEPRNGELHLLHKINFYRVPSKETQWVLFEFVCEKSLIAKHLMTSRRRIRIILTEFISGEHGSKLSKNLVHLQSIYFPPNFSFVFWKRKFRRGKNLLYKWGYSII